MSHPIIADPVLPRQRKSASYQSFSFLSFPVVLIMFCAACGIPAVSSRLWQIDGEVHAHNDAIVHVVMMIAPFFLVAFCALTLFVFIRAGRPIEIEPES